jgi:hypothetical protein
LPQRYSRLVYALGGCLKKGRKESRLALEAGAACLEVERCGRRELQEEVNGLGAYITTLQGELAALRSEEVLAEERNVAEPAPEALSGTLRSLSTDSSSNSSVEFIPEIASLTSSSPGPVVRPYTPGLYSRRSSRSTTPSTLASPPVSHFAILSKTRPI